MHKLLTLTMSLLGLSISTYLNASELKLPIVFHPEYDIVADGAEQHHSFDTKKYGKIARALRDLFNIKFYEPAKVSDADLRLVHTADYLQSLADSNNVAKIAEFPLLADMPNALLQKRVLDPMRYATAGTVLAAQLALKHGWAINLSGGYHHAKATQGGGFCFFADIPLAIRKLRESRPQLKAFVLDLDAHQGNGHEEILAYDPLSFIFDVYVKDNYPRDIEVQKCIRFNHPVAKNIQDREYLHLLTTHLPKGLDEVRPDIIIYNAGTDIFEKDHLGQMSISENGIIERDMFVFAQALQRNIPIVMVLSGGYTKESAGIIAQSLTRVLLEVVKVS